MTSGSTETDLAGGFAERVRSAVIWRWGSQVVAQLITWTVTILIVRLLDPRDFGLFAMAQAVLTALNFLNGYGFATALIQAREVSERRIGQTFGLLILANLGLAAAQFLAAPLVAAYYGQPIVTSILRVQAIVFLTTPFISLPSVLLARQLDFRRQGVVNLVSSIAGSAVGLGLAWFDYGLWALVWAPITLFASRAIGLTIACGGLVKPIFDFRGCGELLGFGTAFTLSQLFWIVQSQSDIVIAGRMFDPHHLGLYSEALFLTLIFTGRFLPPLNEVAFPAYSELKNANKPLAPAFIAGTRMIMLVALPFYVGLSLVSGPLVLTFFGQKWAEMIPIVSGLALAMPAMALHFVCSPATNGLGRPGIYLATSIAGAILMPACFFYGVRYGPMGLVSAWQIAAPALLAFTLTLTLPAIGARLRDLAAAMLPPVMACATMAAAIKGLDFFAPRQLPVTQLVSFVGCGGLVYLGTLWLFWPEMLRENLARIRKPASPAPAL
ncbi:MAG: lipopolysaccharide biosynthesis protein [Novosphingobium sp.]